MDCMKCSTGQQFSLLHNEVQLDVQGWLARLNISLTYRNDSKTTAETTSFSFPMDDSSSVYSFIAEMHNRTIVCESREKSEAKEAFESAVSHGYSAVMAGESDDSGDIFNCYLGNIDAGETVRICLRAVMELDCSVDKEAALTLPRVVVSRYRPAGSGSAPAAGANDWLSQVKVECTVRPVRDLQLSSVTCEQAKVQWKQAGQQFELSDVKENCDVDLRFVYDVASSIPALLVAREDGGSIFPGSEVLTCNLLLGDETKVSQDKCEFVLLIDRSYSMEGSNMQAAKEALLLFLKSLPTSCTFNIVSFGDSYEKLFETSRNYSEISLQEAMELQSSMEANFGGTELLEPLKHLLENKVQYSRAIILITDGEVSNVHEVMDCVRNGCTASPNSRVFSVGIGHGASTSLVKGVARVGKGRAEFVRGGGRSELRRAVIGLLRANQMSVVNEMKLTATDGAGKEVKFQSVPQNLPDSVMANFARFSAVLLDKIDGDVSLKVEMKFGDKQVTVSSNDVKQLTADSSSSSSSSSTGALAAARRQIKDLTDRNESGSNTKTIIQLSTVANLSSAYTSFVGVDKSTKKLVPIRVNDEMESDECFRGAKRKGGFKMSRSAECAVRTLGLRHLRSSINQSLSSSSSSDESCSPSVESLKQKQQQQQQQQVSKEVTDEEVVMQIAALQKFDGSWQPSHQLLTCLGLTEQQVQDSLTPGVSNSTWITAIVVAYFHKKLQHHRDQWQLFVEKAEKFVQENCNSAENLLKLANNLLK